MGGLDFSVRKSVEGILRRELKAERRPAVWVCASGAKWRPVDMAKSLGVR